jgi:integrase
VVHFKVGGRRYSLRKRSPERDAPWYLVGVVAGKRMQRSLDTNVADIARQRAISGIIEPAVAGRWQVVQETKLKSHFATVAEVVEAWRGLDLGAGEAHKRAAANALLNLLRKAGHEEPGRESAAILTGTTAGKFFDAVVRAANDEPDQKAAARVKRSALSVFNQAKAVLQPAALLSYKRAGVNLPEVEEFIGEGDLRRKKFKGLRVQHEPPDWALVEKVVAKWQEMEDGRWKMGWNEFAAVGLELAFGLRAGEVAMARWDWFTVRDGAWWCWADAAVKNQTGEIHVPALDPFWRVFAARAKAEGRWEMGDGFVLQGHETERGDAVFRRVSAWLRSLGWAKQKTNHALRAYAGAEVAIRFGSLFTAQMWLRHESVTTTEKHYTKQWLQANEARRSRVEWARVES